MSAIRQSADRRKGIAAVGGLIGAVLASSCCVVALLLITLGISGAWIGGLTALAPYQGYFIMAALAFLGSGFRYVYWKPKRACDDGSYCASPDSDRIVKIALWIGTLLVLLALGVNFLLPALL